MEILQNNICIDMLNKIYFEYCKTENVYSKEVKEIISNVQFKESKKRRFEQAITINKTIDNIANVR